jgi:superfamily I DNA/RNA helicase
VQSSKGLEFRSVIFIGLGQIETSEAQAAQNMKLLYVGMSRAKERLMITASGRNEFTERLANMTGRFAPLPDKGSKPKPSGHREIWSRMDFPLDLGAFVGDRFA